MKIALVTGSAGDTHCGVGDYTYELAQHLALDAEVHLYFSKDHGPVNKPYEKLHSLFLHPLDGFSMLSLPSIKKELVNGQYDIVHIQYPSKGFGKSLLPGYLPENLAGMNSRSRIAVTLHEWSTSHPLRKLVIDQMIPRTDLFFVTNEAEMMAVSKRTKDRTIIAIPVGNVLDSQRELADVWNEAEGKPLIGWPEVQGPATREPWSIFHYGLPAKGKGFKKMLEALHVMREAGKKPILYLGGEFPEGSNLREHVLGLITEFELTDAVVRVGHIPQDKLAQFATRCMLGVFPFAEGFSSKRSSVASISHLELPLVVGHGSTEEHPYYAPDENNPTSLAVMLIDLLSGRLEKEWNEVIARQRDFARRFSFTNVASSHLDMYNKIRKLDT
ncbi:glycosyltransferase family 4 protein [bacterium]|nr:glycosyltransferase family 4 protein [bacterium]